MKLNPSNLRLELSITLLQITLTLVIAFLYSHHYLNLYYAHWLTWPALLFLSATAIKQPGLQLAPLTRFRYKEMLTILLFQLSLFMIYYGISPLFGTTQFTKNIATITTCYGLFPWGIILLIAIGLKRLHHHNQHDVSVVDLMTQSIRLHPNNKLRIVLHLLIRGATNFSLALTLAAIALTFYGTLQRFSLNSLIGSIVLAALLVTRPGKLVLKKMVQKREYLVCALLMYVLGLTGLLLMLAHILSAFSSVTVKVPMLAQVLYRTITPPAMGSLFGTTWWLSLSGISGVFIANHSRSLTVTQTIVMTLIVPIGVNLLVTEPTLHSFWTLCPHANITGLLGVFGLMMLLLRKNHLPCFILTYFSHSTAPKQRAHQFLFTGILKTILIILFFTIPLGLSSLAFFSCLISMPILELSPLIIAGVCLLAKKAR